MFSVVGTVTISETYRFCNVASFTIVVVDYLLCLPQELELIWPTRWSAGKILYIATRYSAFSDSILLIYLAVPNLSTPTCERVFTASAWLTISGMVISEVVLVFRTWAVWERNSKLFVTLLCILLCCVILSVIFAHLSLSRVEFGTPEQGYPPGCWLVEFLNPIIIFDYIIILGFEIVILGLTLWKCREAIKTKRSKLLITLHRDAILYCFFIALCSLANIINQVIASIHSPSFEELQRVIHSVLTARILLNLRQAVRENEFKSFAASLSLDFEPDANDAGRSPREAADMESRRRSRSRRRSLDWQNSQSRRNVFISYLGTIFSLDSETWSHDEVSARMLETEDGQPPIEMSALPGDRPLEEGDRSPAEPHTHSTVSSTPNHDGPSLAVIV